MDPENDHKRRGFTLSNVTPTSDTPLCPFLSPVDHPCLFLSILLLPEFSSAHPRRRSPLFFLVVKTGTLLYPPQIFFFFFFFFFCDNFFSPSTQFLHQQRREQTDPTQAYFAGSCALRRRCRSPALMSSEDYFIPRTQAKVV